jgi:hypothetical protein
VLILDVVLQHEDLSMNHHPTRALAVSLCAGLLLAGCSGDPQPVDSSDRPSTSATGSAQPNGSTSPAPTSTLTAEEQQAFEEATKVVLAYRQTITDLYSGARTNLNDLNQVAAGEKVLDDGLVELQRSLSEGWRSEPQGAQLVLVSATPVSVSLDDGPDTVIVSACIDASAVTGVSPSGQRTPGKREAADYTVTRTTYLPSPGWAVTRTQVAKAEGERSC